MAEKPIVLDTWEVQAILDGRKTQTRRVVNPQPISNKCFGICTDSTDKNNKGKIGFGEKNLLREFIKLPYQIGDILWVRETFFYEPCRTTCPGRDHENECPFNRVGDVCYGYKAQYASGMGDTQIKWRPSIHMPRVAARIFLRVTDMWVERVQDITPENCLKEGVVPNYSRKLVWLYEDLWNNLNAKRGYGWDANPRVFVHEFERVVL